MKKLFTLLFCTTLYIQAQDISLTVSGAQQTQMPIAIMILDKTNEELNQVAITIKKDLQFTDQFTPVIKKLDTLVSTKNIIKEMQKLCNKGIPLALCLSNKSDNIEWRLYDTMSRTMIQGKKYIKQTPTIRAWAHTIA